MQGIHVQTAYRWYREGTLPVPAQKVGRLLLVSPETATDAARKIEGAGLYTRVSSHDQKSALDGQVAGLSAWTAEAGLLVARVEAEAGSTSAGTRPRSCRTARPRSRWTGHAQATGQPWCPRPPTSPAGCLSREPNDAERSWISLDAQRLVRGQMSR